MKVTRSVTFSQQLTSVLSSKGAIKGTLLLWWFMLKSQNVYERSNPLVTTFTMVVV